jgi:hypothetical protein
MLRSKRARRSCSWGCCGEPCKSRVYRSREKREWRSQIDR